jgi:hypothetical protein
MNDIKSIKIANNLTYADIICLHLMRYMNSGNDMSMPYATTQDGIGEVAGIVRGQVSKVMSDNTHLFESIQAHINGKNKRRAYRLTVKGIMRAEEVKKGLIQNGYNPEEVLIRPKQPEFSDIHVCEAVEATQKALYYMQAGEYNKAEYAMASGIKSLIRARTQ